MKMAAKLKKLEILKNCHASHLSRAITSLEAALNTDNIDPENVSKYLESVEIKFQKVSEDSVNKIELLTEQADIEAEITDLDQLQEQVTNVRTHAQTTLKLVEEMKMDERDKRKKIEDKRFQTDQSREPSHLTPKLPELKVEKFNGDLEKYQEFMDSFTATIDQNPKLEAIDKFRYLRMFLEDKREGDGPKSLIEGFSTTAANYDEALTLIKQTYGQKERIIISHISKLLTLEVKEKPDKGSLRILFNKVKTHVRSLEVLGIDAELYGIFLVPMVLSKLTHALRKEWGKRKQYHNIVKLLDFIEEEIRSVEEARQVESAFAPEQEHRFTRKQTESRYYQGSGASSDERKQHLQTA